MVVVKEEEHDDESSSKSRKKKQETDDASAGVLDEQTIMDEGGVDQDFSSHCRSFDSSWGESKSWEQGRYYNWETFWRQRQAGDDKDAFDEDAKAEDWSSCRHVQSEVSASCCCLIRGVDEAKAAQTDEDIRQNLRSLARLLVLLREYYDRYGMPQAGGPKDQEYVLKEVIKDLYAGGAPVWALTPVMSVVAEGLTGKRGVDFMFLPRKAFVFAPSSGATAMFPIQRGFDMQRLEAMEGVAVRLASYASNTHGVVSVPTRWPDERDLLHAYRNESVKSMKTLNRIATPEALANEILKLASHSEGLFFFINSKMRPGSCDLEASTNGSKEGHVKEGTSVGRHPGTNRKAKSWTSLSSAADFWKVDPIHSELFSRLATIDADRRIDEIDANRRILYSRSMMAVFRFWTAAGSCAIWFSGSAHDIIMAGFCGIMVGLIDMTLMAVTAREERIIFEAVASFIVGAMAGFAALNWPEESCFGAIAVAGIGEVLQGFRIVYSVVEVMSKNSVMGAANFLEGILYTGLIAYFLRLGRATAASIWRQQTSEQNAVFTECKHGVNQLWYLLFVPLAAIGWSGLFNPNYRALPLMALHGILAYLVSWALGYTVLHPDLALFVAALSVTLSSGLVSRVSGRQALGNSVAGLYVLVPGAYMVEKLFTSGSIDFMGEITVRSAIIGLGAWTGTILCSPTVLGANNGLVHLLKVQRPDATSDAPPFRSTAFSADPPQRDRTVRQNGTGAILFF